MVDPAIFEAHDAGISKFDFNDDRELVATVSHVKPLMFCLEGLADSDFSHGNLCIKDMSVCVWDIGKGASSGASG